MKKIVKMLSILFLLGGTSNLAGSQNVQTLAVEKNVNDNEKNKNKKKSNNEKKQHVLEKIKQLEKKLKDSNKNCIDARDRIHDFVTLLTNKIEDLKLQRLNFKEDTSEYTSLTNNIIRYNSMKSHALYNGEPYEVFEDDYRKSQEERDEILEQLDTLKQELTKIDLEPKIEKMTAEILKEIEQFNYYLTEIKNLREKYKQVFTEEDIKLSNQLNDLYNERQPLAGFRLYLDDDDYYKLEESIEDANKYALKFEEATQKIISLKSEKELSAKTQNKEELYELNKQIKDLNETLKNMEEYKKFSDQISSLKLHQKDLLKTFKINLTRLKSIENQIEDGPMNELHKLKLKIDKINAGVFRYDNSIFRKIDVLNSELNDIDNEKWFEKIEQILKYAENHPMKRLIKPAWIDLDY